MQQQHVYLCVYYVFVFVVVAASSLAARKIYSIKWKQKLKQNEKKNK